MSDSTPIVELAASDIRCWTLGPAPAEMAEDDDPLVEAILTAMSYRLVMQEALHALAAVAADHDRREVAYHRLLDERRAAR